MNRATLIMSIIVLLWTSGAYGEPKMLSARELSDTTAGLFDTIYVMPIVMIENRQQSETASEGSGIAASNQVAQISVNNVINAQNISQAVESSPVIVVQRPLQASGVGSSGVNFATWVPWSRELMPFLLGEPCNGVC